MMTAPTQRTRIQLTDYAYQQDIEDRLLVSSLSPIELETLEEILNSSVKFKLDDLDVDCTPKELNALLQRLETCGLLKVRGSDVTMSKERRKALDLLVWRLQEDFRPNMDYLHSLLRRVPIHLLPGWYTLPRSSDDIFSAIIEQFLEAPRTYYRHIRDIALTHPMMEAVLRDLFAHPHYCVTASELKTRHKMSDEAYQELVLLLEFNLAACAGFKLDHGRWVEVLTPFHEYAVYIKERGRRRSALTGPKLPAPSAPFAFLRDLQASLERVCEEQCRRATDIPSEHLRWLETLQLVEEEGGRIHATESAAEWLDSSMEQWSQRLCYYQRSAYKVTGTASIRCYSERDLIEIGKALSYLPNDEWVPLDTFIESLEVGIADTPPSHLEQQGRRWVYVWPDYPAEDRAWIIDVIRRRYWELGLVDVVEMDSVPHIRLTEYGREQFLSVESSP